MTKKQNQYNDSSSSTGKRFKTFDNSGVAPWSDLNHDVLFLVMMQLGFVDFFAFSRVCKSWRSFAFSNRNTFMSSKPPMSVYMSIENNCCSLVDFERGRFNIIHPNFASRLCVGSTCGYLVLFSRETRDFWLVNPITRHEHHFPDYPFYVGVDLDKIRTILVFSPSISRWVFVVLRRNTAPTNRASKEKLSFYIVGKQRWNHVFTTSPVLDLHVLKRKIYTLHTDCTLCELRLNMKQKHKFRLLETKYIMKPYYLDLELVSSDENLYLMDRISPAEEVLQLDFGEMKWVSPEKTIREYAFFISMTNPSAAIKAESWAGLRTLYNSYNYFVDTDKSEQCMFHYGWVWYFPHECLIVNRLDET